MRGRQGVEHAGTAQAERLAATDDLQLQAARCGPSPLDGPFGCAHAAGDMATFECRAGRARGRPEAPLVDQLISVLVPMSMTSVCQCCQWFGGQQCGDMVAADEAAELAPTCTVGAAANLQAQLARLAGPCPAQLRHEGRAPELPHRQTEQQMLHGGVAADHHIDDVIRAADRCVAEIVRRAH